MANQDQLSRVDMNQWLAKWQFTMADGIEANTIEFSQFWPSIQALKLQVYWSQVLWGRIVIVRSGVSVLLLWATVQTVNPFGMKVSFDQVIVHGTKRR